MLVLKGRLKGYGQVYNFGHLKVVGLRMAEIFQQYSIQKAQNWHTLRKSKCLLINRWDFKNSIFFFKILKKIFLQIFKIIFLVLFFVRSKNATVNQKSYDLPSKLKKKVSKSDKNC